MSGAIIKELSTVDRRLWTIMTDYPQLLIADNRGNIREVPRLQALGRAGNTLVPLSRKDLIPLPYGSELFLVPGRVPLAYDPLRAAVVPLTHDPFSKKEAPCYPVSAFISPGYTVAYVPAYAEREKARILPLFSYGAVAYYRGTFCVAAVRVDREKRQDLRFMDIKKVKQNVRRFRTAYPRNRLIRHLEHCALCYGCPAAKNFFLERYEAPLPTSPSCNARCAGCISHQETNGCSVAQERIAFIPTPAEIAEVALHHIRVVRDPVVSFGQGCEGEPLLVSDSIERAVRLIRKKTQKGIINLNTNASRPQSVVRLCAAGLDSIRVSMNSVQEQYYTAYYRPKGYTFRDVLRSVREAKKRGRFVSINYFVMPGVTDSAKEYTALRSFIKKYHVDMIQWRNLNFDSVRYFSLLNIPSAGTQPLGIRAVIAAIHREFPRLMKGYFNPSRERIRRFMK